MKDAHLQGIVNKKPDKQAVTEEEEERMWESGQFGTSSAKSLINTVYFYNGKLFGLRAAEHRSLRLRDITIGSNFLHFRENISKTFHGGIKDLKKKPKDIKHFCHKEGEEGHEHCLIVIYSKYYDMAVNLGTSVRENAFYFHPHSTKLALKKSVIGIHSLNKILPSLCEAIGAPRKTAHCLRVTCASSLFQNNVEEKLIRERTGHVSNAIFQYEKSSNEQQENVSSILGPATKKRRVDEVECPMNVRDKSINAAHSSNVIPSVINVEEETDEEEIPDFDLVDGNFWDDLFKVNPSPNQHRQDGELNNRGRTAEAKQNMSNVVIRNCNVTINNYSV